MTLRKYIFHLDYRPESDKKSFILWAEIFDYDKRINKIATKDDLIQIFEDYLSDFASEEEKNKLIFKSLAFFIPHVSVIDKETKLNSIHQILSKFHDFYPEINIDGSDRSNQNNKISFNKKFIDVLSISFSLFNKLRYELSKVLLLSNKYIGTFSEENTILLSNNYTYYESVFLFIEKEIIGKERYIPGYKHKHYSSFIKNYEYEILDSDADEEQLELALNESLFEFCFFPTFYSKRERIFLADFITTIPQISLYSSAENHLFISTNNNNVVMTKDENSSSDTDIFDSRFNYAQSFINSLLFEITNVVAFKKLKKHLSIEQLRKINTVHPMIDIDLVNNGYSNSFSYISNRGRGVKGKNSEIILSLIKKSDYTNWKNWVKNILSEYKFVVIIDRVILDENDLNKEDKIEEIKDWIIDFGIVNKKNGRTIKIDNIISSISSQSNNRKSIKDIIKKEKIKFNIAFLINQLFKASKLSKTIRKVLEKIISNKYLLEGNSDDFYEFKYSLELTKLELLVFLKNEIGILYQNNININYPKNWKRAKKVEVQLSFEQQRNRASSTSQLGKKSANILSADSIFDLNWKVLAGNNEIDKDEIAKMIQEKREFIFINDEYYELDLKKISKIINKLNTDEEKYKDRGFSFFETLNYDTTDGITRNEINLFDKLLDKKESKNKLPNKDNKVKEINLEAKINKTFNGTLRHYQVKGVEFLYNIEKFGLGSILADDMGLGKTIQIIALLLIKKSKKASLIIAPTTLLYNWESEIKKFAPKLSVFIHYGIEREKENLTEIMQKNDVILTSYGVVKRDSKIFLKKTFPRIIIDEAQNIKNPDSEQSRIIKQLKTKSKIALTGTPIENRLMELWSIMDFCNQGLLFSSKEFFNKFENPISKGDESEKKIELLKSIVTPFIIRRMKTDKNIIDDLPEKQESKIYLPLTDIQIALYDYELNKVENNFAEINEKNNDSNDQNIKAVNKTGIMLATITKLKQICNHPNNYLKTNTIEGGDEQEILSKMPSSFKKVSSINSLLSHSYTESVELLSSKLNRLVQMAKVIESEGRKLLVFTQYVEMGKIIQATIERELNKNSNESISREKEKEVLFFHGSLSAKKRKEMLLQFEENDKDELAPNKFPILILSLRAGGLGLNLTKANYVFHFDRWWNPAVENQAVDRVHRIGQKRNTFVYKFISKGTLEEKIDKLIDSKIELSESILPTSGKSFVSEMGDKEFLELIKRN